jgi:cytochrome c553
VKHSKIIISILLLILLALLSWQCTEKYPADSDHAAAISDGCVACHTNESLLKEVAEPLPHVDGEAGEG